MSYSSLQVAVVSASVSLNKSSRAPPRAAWARAACPTAMAATSWAENRDMSQVSVYSRPYSSTLQVP